MTFHYTCMHCKHWLGEDKRGLKHEPGLCAEHGKQTSPFDKCDRHAIEPYTGPALVQEVIRERQ